MDDGNDTNGCFVGVRASVVIMSTLTVFGRPVRMRDFLGGILYDGTENGKERLVGIR